MTAIVATPPVSEPARPVEPFLDDLVEEMIALRRPEPSRLMVAIFRGTASQATLQAYLKEQYAYSKHAVYSIAAVLSQMLEHENMLLMGENYAREIGFYQTHNHIDLLARLAAAVGLGRDELDGHQPLPTTLGAMYTLDYFCRRSAMEGVAAFSLATEARGDLINERVAEQGRRKPSMADALMRNYGLSEDDVAFYRLHEEIEGDDAELGFAMIRTYADSAYNQQLIRRAVLHTAATFDAMWYGWDDLVADAG